MGSSDNGVGVEQSTTTEVRAAARQADHVGELAGGSGSSANNELTVRELDGLKGLNGLGDGERSTHGKGWHEERSGDGEEGLHDEDLWGFSEPAG